ncbi:helix-turn-helix domain-containing protein [Actinocrispum wychmicini]|uniref:Helix-turn-helix protein n=1 Tax=Actinocrispum wychmicini TaxID=1213861 RepID=A0A4R2IUB0_9PSEU|nr:helix-turn-helix transcriptional regulator [Actinocrispum wychmicini]TCO47986.1 helix-turn-helix protein [Actinocrispum wychmicini]
MSGDWAAVADAIRSRMAELGITQQELVERSGVSVSTIRQLQNNYGPRRRARHTLEDVSKGLQWPAGHLEYVLDGRAAGATEAATPGWQAEAAELRTLIADLAERVETLERKKRSH